MFAKKYQEVESLITEYHQDQRVFVGVVPVVMGTRLTGMIIGLSRESSEMIWKQVVDEAFRLDGMLNRFDPDSEVSRLNVNSDSGPQSVSAEMRSIMELCNGYKDRTSSIFDVTKGGGHVYVTCDGLDLCGATLDFGGFAKGYFLRCAESRLREAGVTQAFVCFGDSSILGIGHHPYGDCWKVSVIDPYSRRPVSEVDLMDSSMSTSGNRPGYESHISDPRTGRKVEERKLAVITSPDPLDAEVLSTVAMIATEEEMAAILTQFDNAKLNYNR